MTTLNPFEQAFAKLKHWFRQAQARTSAEIHDAITNILDRFQPNQCAAFFAPYPATSFAWACQGVRPAPYVRG